MLAAIDKAFGKAGFRYRAVGVEVVQDLNGTFAMLLERGILAKSLYDEYADSLEFVPPAGLGEVRSLVVVAAPSPSVKVLFHLDGGLIEAVIPSTYISSAVRARCEEMLRGVLGPAGFSVARAPVPVKLLAVLSGLAEYGRNNLAYVEGLGSQVRLDAFATDGDLIPTGEPHGGLSRPALRMDACANCEACHHACPTGCIPYVEGGEVIDAKRCLTYLNEHEGAWPDWLDSGSHNCLVGCMRCQRACPVNSHHFGREATVAEFDREETAIILKNFPAEALPAPLHAKLGRLDMAGYSRVLGRNLRALARTVKHAGRSSIIL
jgi:epoxyqueuosine reductase